MYVLDFCGWENYGGGAVITLANKCLRTCLSNVPNMWIYYISVHNIS